MARIFRPSVAETVAYRSRSPALLIPDTAAGFVDGNSGVATLQRVVCVLDPYHDPRQALAYLKTWLPAFGGEFAEVTVVDSGESDYYSKQVLPNGDGQTWTLRKQVGPVPETAIEMSQTLEPDLVVISTQQRLGLRGRLAGSHTERILRACNVPVLLIPSV